MLVEEIDDESEQDQIAEPLPEPTLATSTAGSGKAVRL
jgi:hypothetical protein